MMVRITAPEGKKIKHIPTGRLHSEVIVNESQASKYVVEDSENDPIVTTIDSTGTTLADRVADLEDAVVELAEIITEG
jgi:hypothetical protein